MFDKLIEWLQQFFYLFKCWQVVRPYERGVVFTAGKCRRPVMGPGIHWLWPLNIDEVMRVTVVPDVVHVGMQSATLADGTQVTVDIEAVCIVTDPQDFVINLSDGYGVITSLLPAIMQEILLAFTWEELCRLRQNGDRAFIETEAEARIMEIIKTNCWGMGFSQVRLSQFARTSLRDGVVRVLNA